MFISQLRIANFRQLHDLELGPFREPQELGELIVLAGPNGSGKSSVLELLSFGIANRYSWQYYQSRKFTDHSFAVRIGLTESELKEIEAEASNQEVAEYAREHRGYWMAVNMPDAIPQDNLRVNEKVHGVVSRRFQNFTKRLGFFLRADRGYGARQYDRRRLFDWKNRLKPNHFNNISFGLTTTQYEDMYDFLVEQSYHYIYELGLFHKNNSRGISSEVPQDPLDPYNNLLGGLFPGYSFLEATAEDLSLRVRLPTGDVLPFQDLSSGEKEVFFILSFFLRNDISNSIIIIDEPELHLHPELARKLLDCMRKIKPENQVWCATHSPELIDEAGRERTYYLRMSDDRRRAECLAAVDEGSEIQALRDLFGYSGYVGISKKVVFIEGRYSGADRRTFANLRPDLSREVKLIPVGSSENLYRLNRAILALLESDFARCEFYLIRDRDYLSDATVEKHKILAPGRLFVLSRYHIENYLLDDVLLSEALDETYSIYLSPHKVKDMLFQIALSNSAVFLRDLVSFRFGELFQLEDCSIGNHSEGQNVFTVDLEINGDVFTPLKDALLGQVERVHNDVVSRISLERREKILHECLEAIQRSLNPKCEEWKVMFPGKYLLERFSKQLNLGKWPALQNVLIDRLSRGDIPINQELRNIFENITGPATPIRTDGASVPSRLDSRHSN